MRNPSRWLILWLIFIFPLSGRPQNAAPHPSQVSLFAQSAALTLDRAFPDGDISFLVLDGRSGEILASRWEHPDTPIPLGSLVKPFTALAYGQKHNFQYPVHTCRGTLSGCWRTHGHGDVDLTSAIAYSCNSYFRMLTENMNAEDIAPTADQFGLNHPPREVSGAALAGLGPHWAISPLRLARAYLELTKLREEPAVARILDGMAESARFGTGAEVDKTLKVPGVLVKTGTAACTHLRRSAGDGFTLAMIPADNPGILLLVRQHGVTGAEAARTAGEMLLRIGE